VSAIRIVMVLWGGLFFVLGPMLPTRDGDLWWLRWLGELILRTHRLPTTLGPETFTSAGAPWVPQEWLLGVLVALSMNHGWFTLLSLAVAAIPIGIMSSIYLRSRESAAPEAVAIVLIFTGFALAASFGIRAQVLGWGCFAAFLLFLQRKDVWYYAVIPIVALWANVHASAMLAPVFLAARIVGSVADRGPRELITNRDVWILPLVAVALLCTPLGWHLPAYAAMLATSPIRQYIQEWQPVTMWDPAFAFGAFPLALLIAVGGLRAVSRNKTEALPIGMLLAAALLAQRNIPIFAIAAAPLASQMLSARFPTVRNLSARTAGLERFAIVSACFAFAISGLLFMIVQRRSPPTVLTQTLSKLAADGTQRRLFCENFNTCSVALQYKSIHVFMDGRCDPYPIDIWHRYIATIRVEPAWKRTLQRYDVDVLLASPGSPFERAVSADAAWRAAFRDQTFVLYERT
jgi:hypothetical protein